MVNNDLDLTIARGIEDDELLRELENYFQESDGRITVSRELLSAGPNIDLSLEEAECFFTGLVLNGAAKESDSSAKFGNYDFKVDTDAAAQVCREQQLILLGRRDGQRAGSVRVGSEVQLAATVPPHIEGPDDVTYVSIADEIRDIFFGVDEQVRIASPYFDPDQTVTGDIASLPSRGVETKILTRETEDAASNVKQALNDIHGAIPSSKLQHLSIRDLYEVDEVTGNQAFATHAKLAIADDEFCYVGSANLTQTSLESNFELGLLLRGSIAAEIGALFDRVYAAARPVELPLQ